jgi:hypothetical protein
MCKACLVLILIPGTDIIKQVNHCYWTGVVFVNQDPEAII